MTISRGQMNRQLYMGGGIMNIVPREQALLGGVKKAFKKATKVVKDVASSDVGKAALIGAAAFRYTRNKPWWYIWKSKFWWTCKVYLDLVVLEML